MSKRINFVIAEGVTHDELEKSFYEAGVFESDEVNDDGFHYDMSTGFCINDTSEEVRKDILNFFGKEVEDDLYVKVAETIYIDVENKTGYYSFCDYYVYTLDTDVNYFEEVDSKTFSYIVNRMRKKLDSVKEVKIV